MGSRGTEIDEHPTADNTPEDVAALYAWAKLQGAKYRDYSASRREYRAQVRYRAAKAQLEREVQAQTEAEAGVAEAELATAEARAMIPDQDGPGKAQPILAADQAARRAVAERVEAARRSELSARLAVVALREEREIAEAHASAKRQAMLYEGGEVRLRHLAGPQPRGVLHGDNLAFESDESEMLSEVSEELQQFLFPGWQDFAGSVVAEGEQGDAPWRIASGTTETYRALDDLDGEQGWGEQSTPAWLFSAEAASRPEAVQVSSLPDRAEAPAGDTLFDSREQLAARWFALKGVFDDAGPELAGMPATQTSTPLLAVFSLAGGVGKTSLSAAVARGLASHGENVLLADMTLQGLLPIYFGLHELRPGVTHRVKLETEDSGGTVLLTHPVVRANGDDVTSEELVEEISRGAQENHRMVLDLPTGADGLIRLLADRHPTVLVPIAPDINSVMSLLAVERLFHGITDAQRRPLLPLYVLNQFDASLPLHLDIREVFRRKLGDRLSQVAIRRSTTVGEAMADGMTVLQSAPDDPVAQDYIDLVAWLRSISPASDASRGLRWGER